MQHAHDLRYIRYSGDSCDWYTYDGRRWKRDNSGDVTRRAKQTVINIYTEMGRTADEDERKAIRQHAVRSESERSIEAFLHRARSEPALVLQADALDTDPWLVNVTNTRWICEPAS